MPAISLAQVLINQMSSSGSFQWCAQHGSLKEHHTQRPPLYTHEYTRGRLMFVYDHEGSVVYDPLQALVNFDSCTRVLWKNPRGHM